MRGISPLVYEKTFSLKLRDAALTFSSTFSEDLGVLYIGYVVESSFHEVAGFSESFRSLHMVLIGSFKCDVCMLGSSLGMCSGEVVVLARTLCPTTSSLNLRILCLAAPRERSGNVCA